MGATALTRYASPAAGYFASVNQAKKGIESMKHYKNLGKRVLSLFVAFVMCVSMLPGMALAADGHTNDKDCPKCLNATKNLDHRTGQIWGTLFRYCTCCGRINRFAFNEEGKNGFSGDERACTSYPELHKPIDVEAKNATCTEAGHQAGKICSYCHTTLEGLTPIEPLEHQSNQETWQFNNTHHWKTCINPNGSGLCSVEVDKAEHLYSENLMTECICGAKNPNVQPVECNHSRLNYVDDKNGMTHKVVCATEDCGYEEEAQQHVWVGDKCAFCEAEKPCNHLQYGMVATPNGDGITHTWYCANCKTMLEGFEKADHKMSVKDNGATHTATCSECGFTATEEHTYGDWSAETGSCEKGYIKTRTCTLCGHTHTFNRPGVHERNYEVESIDGETHGEHCLHCGEPMKVAKHTFVNDVCKVCGAAKPTTPPVEPECKHPDTKLSWTDNQDGDTHAVFCNGCWTTIDEAAAHAWENDVCKFCHAKKTETPKPDECKHYLNTVPEQAPTCTEDGMKKHLKCSKCGKVFEAGAATAPNLVETTVEALTINKLSHDLTTTVVEATCTSKGSETTTCTRCGYSEKKELPMIAHTRKDVAAKAPTCLEAGNVEYWTCEVCNKNFTGSGTNSVEITDVTTPALGHDWVEDGKTDSTCSDKGNQHYTCSRCDAVKDEVIDPTGHTPETIAAKTPTCTETGLTEGSKCSVCDAIIEEQETVPALGHDIVTDEAVPATCTGTGLTEGSHCSRCDDAAVAQEVVAALGHDWDNGVVSTAATCDGAGVRTHTCQREGCGETETRAISALGHSAVSYANVAATCTTVGYTGGSYCSRCSAVITARTTVPATGHAWNAGVITTYPTYYSTGLRTYTCATCAATRTETIPQLTYTYDPGYTDPDPDPDPDYQPPVSSNRQPTTTIPDDNTPLGNTPNTPTVTIEDEDTPLANRPLPFIDVASGDWFRPYVSFVYGKGMMTGMSDTLFGPNVSTTRGMIVTIIYRMENASATGVSPFTDVERDEYYADPISWASDNGVVLGYSETLFGPKDNITREQMAAILYRYCVSKGIDVANYGDLSRFPDGDKASDYAVEAMRWAVDRGLIAGMDDGRLDPTGTATRAQVATILNRFCEMIGA